MWQAMNKRENRVYSFLAKWSGPGAILAGILFAVWGYVPNASSPQFFGIAESALGTVVPLLFLLGLAGFRARCVGRVGWLGEAGFILCFVASVWGGVVRPFVNTTDLYRYIMREGWPPWLINWFAWLVVGLIVIGVATTATKALRDYGLLSLTIGSFGWLFFSTGSGGVIETHLGRLAFGTLFCLGWMALGYALWKDTGYSNDRSCALDFRKQARAVRNLVSSFAARFRG